MSGRVIAEVLQIDGQFQSVASWSITTRSRRRSAPVDIRREGGKLAGTLRFADADAAATPESRFWRTLPLVSVGYRITPPWRSRVPVKTIGGRLYALPMVRCVVTRGASRVSVVTIPPMKPPASVPIPFPFPVGRSTHDRLQHHPAIPLTR